MRWGKVNNKAQACTGETRTEFVGYMGKNSCELCTELPPLSKYILYLETLFAIKNF